MKRRIVPLLALGLVAGLFALASPAHATTNVGSDSSFDNGSSFDGRGDITSFGGDYRDNSILLAVQARIPTNPATDTNWINYSTSVIWNLDVNGDSQSDYWVIISNFNGVYAHVWAENGSSPLCSGAPSYDSSSGNIFVSFAASCIGTPSGLSIQTWFSYDTATTTSFDEGPDSGFGAPITRTITTATTTTTQPTTTTTTGPTGPDPTITTAGVHDGYWMLTQNGSIYGFGSARGSAVSNSQPFAHIEPTPTGNGYWALTDGGSIVAKGDAAPLPSIGVFPGEKAVSISSTPSGQGLWVFTDKGRVVALGDAQSFGDMSGTPLNGAILGSVATPTGKGYWMVGSDGGIFTFGDAKFHGSTGNIHLNKPVMAMAPAADGSGYWLVASDGGIFAFDVPFYGSMGGTPLNKPVSGMVPGIGGYMMVAQDGGIFSFGNVAFHGSLGANPPASPVVSVALQP